MILASLLAVATITTFRAVLVSNPLIHFPRRSFQLDEVALKNRLSEVCRRIAMTKTQSNDVPENLWRNEVFHDRGD